MQRAIVSAALRAFAVPVERILHTADAAVAALDEQVARGQARTADVLAQGNARIAQLTTEIDNARRSMDEEVAKQRALEQSTASEKARVRGVLEFFGQGRRLVAPQK